MALPVLQIHLGDLGEPVATTVVSRRHGRHYVASDGPGTARGRALVRRLTA
jgi:hypothetical protein